MIMNQVNNLEKTLTKHKVKQEKITSINYAKCEIHDSENLSNENYINEKDLIQTSDIIKQEVMDEEDSLGEVVLEPSILHKNFESKIEHIKIEPKFDTSSADQAAEIRPSSSHMMEFVEVQYMNVEKTNEYYIQEDTNDPIKLNEGRKNKVTYSCLSSNNSLFILIKL